MKGCINQLENQMLNICRNLAERRDRSVKVLNLLAEITDSNDRLCGSHNKRMTNYASILTKILRDNPRSGYELTREDAVNIISAAKLHDVGKIAVPDDILLKPSRLTVKETRIIRQHPVVGAEIISQLIVGLGEDSILNAAREITASHHEKWNGEGYPARLKGTEIPLSARIVALADVYDALTHERPYKKALPHEQAMEIILHDSPGHFDPYLLRLFSENQAVFENYDINIA